MKAHQFRIPKVLFILSCLLIVMLFSTSKVNAETITPVLGESIYDEADLLTSEEQSTLNKKLEAIGQSRNCSIIVLTVDDGPVNTTKYINDFYDTAYDTQTIQPDAAILIISMGDRTVELRTYGTFEEHLDASICTKIRKKITPDLSDGEYYNAVSLLSEQIENYLDFKYNDNLFFKPWFLMIVAVTIGGVTVLFLSISTGGRITTNNHTYLDEQHSQLVFRHDNYIRSVVTKVKKPEKNSSGGASHSVSSGGHSSSGSRGHF